MQVFTASDVKNHLGEMFDSVEHSEGDSVLIERNRRPVAMLLNAQIAEKIILGAYAQGVLPRSMAMQQLGLSWYGDLLSRMNELGIPRPVVTPEDNTRMQAAAHEVFDGHRPNPRPTARRKRASVR